MYPSQTIARLVGPVMAAVGIGMLVNQAVGFGLGLTIAKAVAEAHGGTLTLHDRAPHGLVARITLPAGPPSTAVH